MAFERRRPGEPVRHSATEWNAFIDAALAHKNKLQSMATPEPSALPFGMVFVKNTTGSDRALFDVLALDTPLFAADKPGYKGPPAFAGVTPDPENKPAHRSRVAILAAPLKADAIGRAYIGGQFAMPVDVIHLEHTRARVLANYKLQSGFYGPVRLLGAKSTGDAVLSRVDVDSFDGGHCLAKVPTGGGITAGTYSAPSTTECVLAWSHPTTGAATDVAGSNNKINVVHFGAALTGIGYVRCRIDCGRIVPDVAYC